MLGDLVEACRLIGLAGAPFLPATAPRLLAQLGYEYPYGDDGNGGPPILDELLWGAHSGEAGRLESAEPLFPRLDVEADATPDHVAWTAVDPLMRLIDSHGHVQADRFAGDVELVLGGARLAGVERILVPGWDPDSSAAAVELVGRYPWLDAAVGVHPHDAATVDDAGWAGIVALAADPRVRAIGETGLDTDRGFSPFADQLVNLRRNLALALATGKPAILHCRSKPGERDAQDALVGGAAGCRLRRGGGPGCVRRAGRRRSSTRIPGRSTTARP